MTHVKIRSLIKQVDTEFSPAFSENNDIDAYIDKIIKNAILFEVIDCGLLKGLVAMYCNDLAGKVAYVTMVAVDKSARGKGLATSLIHMAIDYAKRASFEKLSLEVYKTNKSALELYKHLGFSVVIENTDSYILDFKFRNLHL